LGLPLFLFIWSQLGLWSGWLAPLPTANSFIGSGAEIGVILLLFMLGLEYTGEELAGRTKARFQSRSLDGVLNFLPGLIIGLLLGWKPIGAILLGGVTWISSSSIIAKVLGRPRPAR
jgi:CPA2 family monovalent cation:H+ antiporter-2